MVVGMSIQMLLRCEINASVWPRTSLGPVKILKNWEGRTGRHPFPNRWFICHPLFHIPTRCSLIQLFIMHLKLSPCLTMGPVNLSMRFSPPAHTVPSQSKFFFCDCMFFHTTPSKKEVCSNLALWSATNISKQTHLKSAKPYQPFPAFRTANPFLNRLKARSGNWEISKSDPKTINLPSVVSQFHTWVFLSQAWITYGLCQCFTSMEKSSSCTTPNHPQPPSPTTSPNRPQRPSLGPRRCLRAGDSLSALQLPRLSFWGSAKVPRLRARGPMTWMGARVMRQSQGKLKGIDMG